MTDTRLEGAVRGADDKPTVVVLRDKRNGNTTVVGAADAPVGDPFPSKGDAVAWFHSQAQHFDPDTIMALTRPIVGCGEPHPPAWLVPGGAPTVVVLYDPTKGPVGSMPVVGGEDGRPFPTKADAVAWRGEQVIPPTVDVRVVGIIPAFDAAQG